MYKQCSLCSKSFTKHRHFEIHIKSVQHLRILEQQSERERFILERKLKQEYLSSLKSELSPIWEEYLERVYKYCNSTPVENLEPESSDLSESLLNHYQFSRPSSNCVKRRKSLYKFISDIVANLYPEARLEVYGSIPLKLDAENSDIDVSIYSTEDEKVLLNNIADGLSTCEVSHLVVERVLNARIPLITITDSMMKLQLDLSIWMLDKLEISEVTMKYLKIDERIRPFLKGIRHWAKGREITDAYNGYINSFAWTVMGIAFLQINEVVPHMDLLDEPFETENTQDVGELFLNFFGFISNFDYKTKRISIRHGGVTEKEADRFQDNTVLCVERPRTAWQNITRQVTYYTLKKKLLIEFRRAYEMLQDGALLYDIAK